MNYISLGNRLINLDNVVTFSLREIDDEYLKNDESGIIEGEGSHVISISIAGGFNNIYYAVDDIEATKIWDMLKKETNATYIK